MFNASQLADWHYFFAPLYRVVVLFGMETGVTHAQQQIACNLSPCS
jgi:hypothetical protein